MNRRILNVVATGICGFAGGVGLERGWGGWVVMNLIFCFLNIIICMVD